jgi:hypothetical protein
VSSRGIISSSIKDLADNFSNLFFVKDDSTTGEIAGSKAYFKNEVFFRTMTIWIVSKQLLSSSSSRYFNATRRGRLRGSLNMEKDTLKLL